MTTRAIALAAEIRTAASERGGLLFLSDFDGTLTPIAASPATPRLPVAAQRALAALARQPATAVGVISGRDIADLRGRLDLPDLICAGCHGLVVEGPDLRFLHPQAAACRELMAYLARIVARQLGSIHGVEVEPKDLAVAVHYRHADPDHVAGVLAAVGRIRDEHAPAVTTRSGKKVVELLPDVLWDKGECVLWIRDRWAQRIGRDPAIVYLGDDETDETAFRALHGKGLGIRVDAEGAEGEDTAATRRLPDVSAVHELLTALTSARVGP